MTVRHTPAETALSFASFVETFGKFQLVERLGAGGMGEVFLARPDPGSLLVDGVQPERVVVKRILPHLTGNPRFLRLFLDETRIAARLVHRNIARVYELGEVKGTWYVAMEHVPGKDLRELLRRARAEGVWLAPEVALRIGVEVAGALEHAHRATDGAGRPLRIVHRDVSPHNVLVSRYGDVKLCDFGVAKATNKAVHTASGILKGKFPYMAPEQASAKRVDPRTDVFALGIVLWEALTNRYLFRGKSDAATVRQVRACEVSPPSAMRPELGKDIDRVILKALEKEPKKRWADATAFKEALQEVLASRPPADVQKFFHALESLTGGAGDETGELETVLTGAEESVSDGETVQVRKSPLLAKPAPAPPRAMLARAETVLEHAVKSTNLPPQSSSFVGRVAELADLHQVFRAGARLMTLLGPGGTGKSRLAIQLGHQLLSHYTAVDVEGPRGGVWVVDLSDVVDRDGLCTALARALDVPLTSGNSVEQLATTLRARGEILVVLDTFERLVEHAEATVGRWLEAAPRARFVVASRTALQVPHEHVFEVPALRVPARGESSRAVEAVELFVERARAVRPGWDPDPAEEAAVGEICRQLDGLPLAIELAAAWLATLSPAQLLTRLPQRLDILSSKAPGTSDRQATLRGAIDWSWRTLNSAEASTLAQLSLFRGGFSREAAEAVVDLSHFPDSPDPLSTVLALRSRSLVRAYFPPGARGEQRYGLYDTIREFAREKLAGTAEERPALERHGRFFIGLGGRFSAGAEGNASLLDALELERDNLSAVFQRALGSGRKAPLALSAALALDPLHTVRGPFLQHLAMLDHALELLPENDSVRRALGLEARARLLTTCGRLRAAAKDAEEMLALARQDGAIELEGRAQSHLGVIERLRGDPSRARVLLDAALSIHREVGDRRMEGRTLSHRGQVLEQTDEPRAALAAYTKALEMHREVSDRRYEGLTLLNLGGLLQAQGEHARARAHIEDALVIERDLGNRHAEGIARHNLGDLCRDLGAHAAALMHYQAALVIAREVGSRRGEGLVLAALGSLAQEQGALEDCIARWREALRVLDEVEDRRAQGLARAALAAAEASLGQVAQAERLFEEASFLLKDLGDSNFLDALEVYRAHLELAQAQRVKSPEEAATLEASLEARITRAQRPVPADVTHPEGQTAPDSRSEPVRAALRALRAAMRRAGRAVA